MDFLTCPSCGKPVKVWQNPAPTVDVIVYDEARSVVLIKRGRPPYGYALPGGFVEVGESIEEAAVREAFEETALHVELTGLLGVYSAPNRDPRRHTISAVFVAKATNPEALCAGDDAAGAFFFPLSDLPEMVFDHAHILEDFKAFLEGRRRAADIQKAQR